MKKGFTMIELIFVIVILGILAAVAIPRLAATRDDATLAGIKTDVTSAMQAIPAWYQGQKDARILQAIQLDATKWKVGTGSYAGDSSYQWSDDAGVCVVLAIYDMNDTAGTLVTNGIASGDINTTNGQWLTAAQGAPVLRVINANSGGDICNTLWSPTGLGLQEANITMAGKKVTW